MCTASDMPAATNVAEPPPTAKPAPLASPYDGTKPAGVSALRLQGKGLQQSSTPASSLQLSAPN